MWLSKWNKRLSKRKKGQLATLMEMVLNMQGQLNKIKTTSNSQITGQGNGDMVDLSESTAQETQNQNISMSQQPPMQNSDFNSEITNEQNVVPGTAAYSEITAPRDETRNISQEQSTTNQNTNGEGEREHTKDNESRSTQKETRRHPASTISVPNNPDKTANKTLLTGDSLLAGVNRKGLKNGVHCQSFPGATISMI